MDIIIYAHPDANESHNAAVRKYVEEKLKGIGKGHETIDLYADGFNPVLSLQEASGKGGQDALVKKYQEKIMGSERLIFIFPVWWYAPPAILKGFFDRVFTPGFAYNFKKMPELPRPVQAIVNACASQKACYGMFLKNLPIVQKLVGKKAVVINTFGGNEIGYNLFGNAPEYSVDKAVLNFCGIFDVRRVHWFEARGSAALPDKLKEEIDAALA